MINEKEIGMDKPYDCVVYFCDDNNDKPFLSWFSWVEDAFNEGVTNSINASPSECLMMIPSWEAFEKAC
jgi:hypothetical protein